LTKIKALSDTINYDVDMEAEAVGGLIDNLCGLSPVFLLHGKVQNNLEYLLSLNNDIYFTCIKTC